MSQMISSRSDNFQAQSQGEPAGLLTFPLAVLRTVRHAWNTHADRKLLAELSDHQLRDIGIRREHITHVVRHGWDF
ncbi:MAG TPA: DUF1127 domain-containing protein [Dongiaceae bacterium]|nr:DUF1127 domain-containing protein [Dongiaceae bacterium]